MRLNLRRTESKRQIKEKDYILKSQPVQKLTRKNLTEDGSVKDAFL